MGIYKTIAEEMQYQIDIKTPEYWIKKISKYRKRLKDFGIKVASKEQLVKMNVQDLEKYFKELVAEFNKNFIKLVKLNSENKHIKE